MKKLLIHNLKLGLGHSKEDLDQALRHRLGLTAQAYPQLDYEIEGQSLDARKQPLSYNYRLALGPKLGRFLAEHKIRVKDASWQDLPGLAAWEQRIRQQAKPGAGQRLVEPPVVVGSGPAGLMAAYGLALAGLRPYILEQGQAVEERAASVQDFWSSGELKPSSNVQFGEGGAGTFSDGKLTSRSKDPRQRAYLELLVRHGAPRDILFRQHPHVGTDLMQRIIPRLRQTMEDLGARFYFNTQVREIAYRKGSYRLCCQESLPTSEQVDSSGLNEVLTTPILVLALGHSARPLFRQLRDLGLAMAAKPFAVGLRIEHPQSLINQGRYHEASDLALSQAPEADDLSSLPPANYQLKTQAASGRAVYTFCMCPGGLVVNASSEPGRLCVNGMSYHARNLSYANSAVLTTVGPSDFGEEALAGMIFQEHLEEEAYQLGQTSSSYKSLPFTAPLQTWADFSQSRWPCELGSYQGSVGPARVAAPLHELFPPSLYRALKEGIEQLGRQLPGFDTAEALLTGVEARSSSPLRLLRDKTSLEALGLPGLYPAGEGAGYAGGIVSSALDGMRVAEAILAR
ncbi:MAG: FAD-binding protein [Eubacteriales bacterium]|nr:FAD-binding protein [Eubacteriales bacterium]